MGGGILSIARLDQHTRPLRGPLNSLALARNSHVFQGLFTDERRTFFDQARTISTDVLAPKTCQLQWGSLALNTLLPAFAEFRGVGIPPEYGGAEGFSGIVDSVILHQCLAYGSASAAAFFDGNGLFTLPLLLAGSEAQKREYLPRIASGEIIGCYGLTDTECGSDVANMRSLKFTNVGLGYLLNGAKTFVTNGPVADHAVVFACYQDAEPDERGRRNITAFVVPRRQGDRNGFEAGEPMDKLGWRASHTSEIHMADTLVSADDVIGDIGQGFLIAVTTLSYGRLKIAAEALGLMERALDETMAFIEGRRGVGGRLKDQPLVHHQIAEIVKLVEATRNLIYNAAFLAEQRGSQGQVASFASQAAHAKNFAGKALEHVVNIALPLHGGYGFMREYPISVIYCDAPLYRTGEGAENVVSLSMGTSVLGR